MISLDEYIIWNLFFDVNVIKWEKLYSKKDGTTFSSILYGAVSLIVKNK